LAAKTGKTLAVTNFLQLHPLIATDDEMVVRNSPEKSASTNLQRIVYEQMKASS